MGGVASCASSHPLYGEEVAQGESTAPGQWELARLSGQGPRTKKTGRLGHRGVGSRPLDGLMEVGMNCEKFGFVCYCPLEGIHHGTGTEQPRRQNDAASGHESECH